MSAIVIRSNYVCGKACIWDFAYILLKQKHTNTVP